MPRSSTADAASLVIPGTTFDNGLPPVAGQGLCPLEDLARHVERAERARTGGIPADRQGVERAAIMAIQKARIEFIPPRKLVPIRSPSSLFPLILCWQTSASAGPARQPPRIGLRICDNCATDLRMICSMAG